jgi:microcystin-dependent protein
MSDPFIAEIRIFGFNFPPRNWAQCDGQLLLISANPALFSLLGTTYGGDGRTTFGLPDLRGRAALHPGTGFSWGQRGGEEAVTLAENEMPAHTHAMQASSANATANSVSGNVLARSTTPLYASPGTGVSLSSTAVGPGGSSQGHPNMMPFRTVNFCIALIGLFPSRS